MPRRTSELQVSDISGNMKTLEQLEPLQAYISRPDLDDILRPLLTYALPSMVIC